MAFKIQNMYEPWVAESYMRKLGLSPSKSDLELVLEIARKHPDFTARREAVEILGRTGYIATREMLRIMETDKDEEVRSAAKRFLANNFDEEIIRHKCQHYTDNPFGQNRDKLALPVEAIIAAIDTNGGNRDSNWIGLSAFQMRNLGIPSNAPKEYLQILEANEKNIEGLFEITKCIKVYVKFNQRGPTPSLAYNAGGALSIGGCGIRVSSMLAERLGLELEDKVKLYYDKRKE